MKRTGFLTHDQGIAIVKMHRSLGIALALTASVSVAACKPSEAPSSQDTGSASESADALGPDAKPGVTAGAARLVLPVVPRRPGVIYFRVANMSKSAVTLAGVHVDGVGRAEMHRTNGGAMKPVDRVDIAPGATIAFAPGGLHAMAFDVAERLKAGGQSEMTLTFADGDKTSLPVKVEAMGADGGMAGMSH